MKYIKKRVLVVSLIAIILIVLAASLSVGLKLFPTYYDEFNNSLKVETLPCNDTSGCNFTRYFTLPEDYRSFGDSIINIKGLPREDWVHTEELDIELSGDGQTKAITTNTTDGTEPEHFWIIKYDNYDGTLKLQKYYQGNFTDIPTQLNTTEDLNYDPHNNSIWVLGTLGGIDTIDEYQLPGFNRIQRFNESDWVGANIYPGGGIAVSEDYIYLSTAAPPYPIVKISKSDGSHEDTIYCPVGNCSSYAFSIETINGTDIWWGEPGSIVHLDNQGNFIDKIPMTGTTPHGFTFSWNDDINISKYLGNLWIADASLKYRRWKKAGYPENVSLKVGDDIIWENPGETQNSGDLNIADAINNYIANHSLYTIPFVFETQSMGDMEYSYLEVYADNQSFPVKIVYPEPDSYHDMTLNVSIYYEDDMLSSTPCTYDYGIGQILLGSVSNATITPFTITDIENEGNLSLSFDCQNVGLSDDVEIVYDKRYPSIEFDTYTQSVIGGSFGQESIYFGIVGSDPTEENTTFYLYDSNLILKNITSGKGLRSANFSVAGDSGLYYFNVTMVDEFGRSNTTSLGSITVDSTPPYPIVQNLNTSSLDMNYQKINIEGYASDDINISNATTTITWPNGTQESYINCINGGTYCSYSFNYTPHQISGNYSIQTRWTDKAGNTVYSDIDYFYARGTASINTNMEPNGTIVLESQNGTSKFYVNTTMKNTGDAGAYDSEIYLTLPPGWTSEPVGTVNCSTIFDECNVGFEITVPENASSTSYVTWANFKFMNPDLTFTTSTDSLTIVVSPNKATTILEDELVNDSNHNVNDSYVGILTVKSTGNAAAYNIIVNSSGGNLPASWLSFRRIPYFSFVGVGQSREITIEITVPAGVQPGVYDTLISLYSDGVYRDNMNLIVTILPDLSWTIDPIYIPHQELPTATSGFFDSFNVTNVGNTNLTFTASPRSSTLTGLTVDPNTDVTVESLDSFVFDINYAWDLSLGGGYYEANITVIESNTFTEKYSYINVTLTDMAPIFHSFDIPEYVAINTPFSVTMNITDNLNDTPAIWGTFTRPDQTLEDAIIVPNTDYEPPLYEIINYVPFQAGLYTLTVWADDGIQPPVNSSRTFESINETFFSIENNIDYMVVDSITSGSGYQIEFNISINNTGRINGSSVIINVSYPAYFSNLMPPEISYANFGGYEILPFNITINASTPPQAYLVTPAVHWTNPDLSKSYNTTLFYVDVTSNKILSILTPFIEKSIIPDTTETVSFTASSTGNDKLSNITISCYDGIACSDFEIDFSNNNFDLAAGDEEIINMDIYVPHLYDAGTYPTIINASAEDDEQYLFNIIVPEDNRWLLYPDNLTVNAGVNSQGHVGKINISNIGNVQLYFNISVSNESAINPGSNYISVPKNGSTEVDIYYTAPSSIGNHSFDITVFNDEYTVPENTVEVIISVINFSVIPTSGLPVIDIYPNDTINIFAEAFYEADELEENVSWSVEINDTSCAIINFSYIDDLWNIYCSAPDLNDGYYYNLDLIGVYEDFDAEYIHTTDNAIHYKDITPPEFTDNDETDVINGTNVTLTLSSSDNIGVVNAWVEVQYPDGGINYSMALVNDTYQVNISGLDIGDYDVTYYINDTGDNIATHEDWFEVYIPVNFSGDVLDSENKATNTTFKLYRPGTGYLLYEFNSTTEYGYNLTNGSIHRRNYDMNITIPAVDIELFNVTVNETTNDQLDLDEVVGEEVFIALYKPLVGIGILSNLSIKGSEINVTIGNDTTTDNVKGYITINYGGMIYGSKNNIIILKCADWNYAYGSCDSAWDEQNVTNNVVLNTVTVEIESFSAYMAAEARCGDYGCEATYGENIVTCPIDCDDGSGSAPPSRSGGGGGGISRRAMEELLKKYVNDTNATGGLGLNISKEIKAALESPMQIQGVKVATTSIYRELFPGEELSTGIILRNVVEDQTVTIKARTVGTIADFILFDSETVTLNPLQEMNFGISIVADPFTMAGSYEGSIILESGGKSLQIPVSLRVQEKTEKLLDMKIQPLVDRIAPNEDMKLQIDIYNLGKTPRVDVLLTYQLVDALTEEVITEKQESIAIETTLSQIRTLHIPEDTRLGKYLVRGLSSYLSYNKTSFASSLAYVDVARPWYLYNLFGVIPVWIITAVLLFVGLNAGMFMGYQEYQARKKKYKIALDLKELPQPGDKTAYIGHIAESSIRTFLEVNKMQTHTIVAGSTGGGKTVAAQVLIEEALRNNVGVIVFDPTAQWTGFLRPCKERRMLKYYPKFQMKQKQAQAFNGNIHHIEDARQIIDIKKFMKPGEINIFSINKLKLKDIDIFVANTIRQMFNINLNESPELRLIMVYDEVHRLLPKFGGSGEGFMQIERACREFRKWGVGLVLISQVLSDFIGSIKANINTEIQVRTRDEGDLDRIKTKYGEDIMKSIVKASVGTAMFQNSAYNKGRPYFVDFRPLLHSITRLDDDDLAKYQKFNDKIDDYEYQMEQLEQEKVDVFDLRLELKLALDKLKVGKFNMVNIYLEGIGPRLSKHWDKIGKEPKKKEIQLANVADIQKAVKDAEKARKEFEKKNKGKAGAEAVEEAVPEEQQPTTEEAAPAEAEEPEAKEEPGEEAEKPAEEATPKKAKKTAAKRKGKPAAKKPKAKKASAPASKETAKQPDAAPDPIEQLEDRYKELQEKLSAKRKQGEDTSMIEINMKSIPADIKMFAAMGDKKIKKKIEKNMDDIEKKLK